MATDLTYRFGSRLKARQAVSILWANNEVDIVLMVWSGAGDGKYITISVVPRDCLFVQKILSVDGMKWPSTRASLIERAGSCLEFYQGEAVLQFLAWRKKRKEREE